MNTEEVTKDTYATPQGLYVVSHFVQYPLLVFSAHTLEST